MPGAAARFDALHMPLLVLAASVGMFVGAQFSIDKLDAWWLDELFALWASEPAVPYSAIFIERIGPDTNPPFYFSALYLSRTIIADDRLAVIVLNALALCVAFLAVLAPSRRQGHAPLALLGFSLFLLSGPVMRYMLEARVYLCALALVFVAAWYCALTISNPRSRISIWAFVVLGLLAASMHVYAALACGALGAGLLLAALLLSDRSMALRAFVLGGAATLGLALWIFMLLSLESSAGARIDWLDFSIEAILKAGWYTTSLVAGEPWVLGLIFAVTVYGLITPTTRVLTLGLVVAGAVFLTLPVAISMLKPILHGRYWTVGAPMLVVLITFLIALWVNDREREHTTALAGAGLLIVASSMFGYATAGLLTQRNAVWAGAETVSRLGQMCPHGSIHIHIGPVGPFEHFEWGFPKTSGLSAQTFTLASDENVNALKPEEARCPVLGWAEHMWIGELSDADLLRLVKVDAHIDDVDIRTHKTGFVVLNRALRP